MWNGFDLNRYTHTRARTHVLAIAITAQLYNCSQFNVSHVCAPFIIHIRSQNGCAPYQTRESICKGRTFIWHRTKRKKEQRGKKSIRWCFLRWAKQLLINAIFLCVQPPTMFCYQFALNSRFDCRLNVLPSQTHSYEVDLLSMEKCQK